ncbi:DEAD/DEAH box helicase [Streptomyces sp. DH37]|uniref:DEAD/DEAH box helicase n=1 Tax=Streptomyces sp. DH37 TaxID=3040122 RepID=UPI002441CE5A|nr:DEAD/DEAH box helicase [Streptomyces sp. DH37]MDG9700983.1 DEAD/DEAH box helicase [Streptomyces sp. DH37]
MAPTVAPTPSPSPSSPPSSSLPPVSPLADCAAVFLPADPPRLGRIAFWRPDGEEPPAAGGRPPEELTVVLPSPGAGGRVRPRSVPALVLPVADALPVLTRIRAARGEGAPAFWGAAVLLALHLAARGRLLPGLSPRDHDAWRFGPLDPADLGRLRDLAAAMPPYAHAVPLPGAGRPGPEPDPRLPDPERLLRAFLDAVADVLPRTPAAETAAGGTAFAAAAPQHLPEQRAWAAGVAAGHDAGVRLSLRVEVTGPDGPEDTAGPRFRAVLRVHSPTDPAPARDAAELWSGALPADADPGPRARADTLLALRRAAAAWEPLAPLLSAAVPDHVDLTEEEVAELLGAPVTRALSAAGLTVHWPRELLRTLTTRAVVGPGGAEAGTGPARPPASRTPSPLSADALLSFSWRFAVGDQELSRAELDGIAEAGRPLVRLRDRWVLVDPAAVQRARARRDRDIAPLDALGAALTGSLPGAGGEGGGNGRDGGDGGDGGETVEVRATGWLEALRERLSAPERPGPEPVPQPPALAATLRDYQLRGLDWLHRMTSLGLGCCLADDMGLGKTVTLVALHLHRQGDRATAGPTLVVCPASLLGNWQREIERFAPGTPVRRHHGAARDLSEVTGGFVLTTYGTMRLDASELAAVDWGLVVADEAQHVKNPFSSTARRLRAIPSRARVALTGTPVENNLSELWAVLDWTTPGLLGSLGAFRRLHADAVESGDPAAAERLTRLVRPFLLRRRKSDPGVAPELPPKTETDRAVALTAEQAGLYEAVVREGLAGISEADGIARRGRVVGLLTALKQICNHPAQYLKEESPRLAGRSGKLELLDELLDTILAEGAGVLVFTQYVRMAELLELHLTGRGVRSQLLHGGTPVRRREEMVRRFQNGEAPVFLLSLKAAGTGLNLTRAEHVVHFDRWWNPAVEAQATDRAYRIGQDRPVQVHRLIAEGTVEDRIARLLARKQALADAVLGSGEGALTELSDAELADLVELRRSGT